MIRSFKIQVSETSAHEAFQLWLKNTLLKDALAVRVINVARNSTNGIACYDLQVNVVSVSEPGDAVGRDETRLISLPEDLPESERAPF